MAVPTELVEDGFLDANSNYTAFVEVIVPQSDSMATLSPTSGISRDVVGRTPYMRPRKPGQTIGFFGAGSSSSSGKSAAVSAALISVLGVLAGLVTVALLLLIALVLLRRYSKQVK